MIQLLVPLKLSSYLLVFTLGHPLLVEGGPNQVRLPYNPCGCVYGFDLTPEFDVTRMYGERYL